MFATLFFAVADAATGELRFVNGGHEAPLLLAPSGAIAAELAPTGPAVGMLPDSPFTVGAAVIAPGQTLFAYTDGVTDAKGSGGFFGRDRLLALLDGGTSSAAGLLERLGGAVRAHVGEAERFDDLTALAVLRRA
jgi:sigma-B regulation protein RsbU (phosphoserine phosphatase)